MFSPFILVSNLIIKETNAFLLYKKLVLLLIFLVTTLNIIDPSFFNYLQNSYFPVKIVWQQLKAQLDHCLLDSLILA